MQLYFNGTKVDDFELLISSLFSEFRRFDTILIGAHTCHRRDTTVPVSVVRPELFS